MEIASLHKQSIRIKGKQATFVVDPQVSGSKTVTDGIILMENDEVLGTSISGQRLVIAGPGDYELGGVKIAGSGHKGKLLYGLNVDGVELLITTASTLEKPLEGREYDIVICNANATLNPSSITALSPKVVVVYGEQAQEALKVLGKEGTSATAKYQTTADKLPEELEVVLLA